MNVGSTDPLGLANNLKSLINAKNQFGTAYPKWIKSNYGDLFKPILIPKLDRLYFNYRFDLIELDQLPENYNLYWFPGARHDGKNIDHMFMFIPENIRTIITQTLWDLNPQDAILQACYDFYDVHRYDIAVHYRTFQTDDHDKFNFGHNDEELIDLLNSMPRARVFVASDNMVKGLAFMRKLNHDCCYYEGDLKHRRRALCDMILLSMGQLLFSPQYSTFSELSWYWGFCRQDVCNYKSSNYLLDFETIWHKGSSHAIQLSKKH